MNNMKVNEHHLSLKADPHRIKIIAEALSDYMLKHSIEDDTTLSDFRFNLESAYQTYHKLDQDDWGFVEPTTNHNE